MYTLGKYSCVKYWKIVQNLNKHKNIPLFQFKIEGFGMEINVHSSWRHNRASAIEILCVGVPEFKSFVTEQFDIVSRQGCFITTQVLHLNWATKNQLIIDVRDLKRKFIYKVILTNKNSHLTFLMLCVYKIS